MLAAHPELDAVVVVVPNFLHAPFVIDALKAGKHVLTEKPIATDLIDAQRMIEAASHNNRILQVAFEWRYCPVFHRMAELIGQDAIGRLELVYAALFRGDWNPRSWKYTDPDTGKPTNWRFLTHTTGGSLMEDGIHELDVIHWLVGAEPSHIVAQGGNNVLTERETIDNAELLIEFVNKTRCMFGFSLFTPYARDGFVMRFYGSQGEMVPEWGDKEAYVALTSKQGKSERIPVPYFEPAEREAWTGMQKKHPRWDSKACDMEMSTYRVHKSFLHSIASGAPPFSSGEVGRQAIQISLAAEQSLRDGGRTINVTST
jgi:predicted dehydrogenase